VVFLRRSLPGKRQSSQRPAIPDRPPVSADAEVVVMSGTAIAAANRIPICRADLCVMEFSPNRFEPLMCSVDRLCTVGLWTLDNRPCTIPTGDGGWRVAAWRTPIGR
jgi:hypothetical protein